MRYNLYTHIQNKHKEKIYLCNLCNTEYKSKSGLYHHNRSVHNEQGKDYKCQLCDLTYKIKSHLKGHIKRTHLKDLKQNYNCKICSFSTTTYAREM